MTRARPSLTVVRALAKRDLRRYFSNPTGYVFITLFILLSAAAAFWRPRFFLNDLANLDQLNEAFPYLLLFFVPALSMGLWSEEKKQGTDELLLTLPSDDSAVVMGKYLAALGIYALSIVVSLSHSVVLRWLGHPDWGLLAANYLGFFVLGAALIPLALCASLVTANATIAFILGAALCAVPIGLDRAGAAVSADLAAHLSPFGAIRYFQDFTRGIVSLSGILYFVALAAVALYACVQLLERRRWRRATGEWPTAAHRAVQTAFLAVAAGCAVGLSARTHARVDLTAEHLYSLSAPTRTLLATLPADRAVTVQAFISRDMPEALVQTRENLLGVLREMEARAGSRLSVAILDTDPYSDEARVARERYAISPRDVADASTGETAHDVYLGVAVTSGPDEQVIPFFDRGLSPEYELARAIRVVTRAARKRIGVIDTDVKMLGGVDDSNGESRPVWAAVQELRNQYDVVDVTPASAADAQVDALVVVLPSRMTQTDLDLAMQPAMRGTPTLLLLDPLPLFDLNLAPAADLANQIDPYRPAPAARVVFGNIREALERIGLNWVPAKVVWDAFNPHPDMLDLPQETVFVSDGNGNPDAFNRRSAATAGLQELMMLYPGYLVPAASRDFSFEPLLEAGSVSGTSSFFDLVVPTSNGMRVNANVSREPDHQQHVLAARIRSERPIDAAPGARPVDAIAIADLDFVSDYFFDLRNSSPVNVNFDNITFFLNSIDLLSGDDTFIALRSHKARHRTLERVEARTSTFMERRAREEQLADRDANAALGDARARLKQRLDDLNSRADLDAQAKQVMVRNLQETENRQLRMLETNINETKNARIRASRETMEGEIRRIRTRIQMAAILLPPLPVLLVGTVLFVKRTRREREGERALRRVRDVA